VKKIQIKTSRHTFDVELFDTPTAQKIYEILPLKGSCILWGEEIYFSIPLHIPSEADAHEIVEPGDLGYWPTGNAFCLFFGPTPVSKGPKPRAYSPVNVFGKIVDDLSLLKTIKSGELIEVKRYLQNSN